jgi:hypothetical protein
MSDHEDDSPAARGALGSRARRTADRDDDRHRPWRKSDFPSDDAAFERCRVKSHEDFPRHIYSLFLVLGIQFRWVLTRGTLARALVSQADLAIDDAKENAWMTLYEHDRDTLEDILYHRLQDLWAPLTDAMKVFDTHGSDQQLCAQKVWEALLTAFPLDHKRMQTVLLAREIARMMRWDGDSKGAVNRHFASVTELHHTMGYIGNLSIEDVLKSVLMATLKASTNRASFDVTLTSDTLLHRAATFPELHGVTKAPTARLVRRSTKRALSPVMVCLPFFATSSTIMVSSL